MVRSRNPAPPGVNSRGALRDPSHSSTGRGGQALGSEPYLVCGCHCHKSQPLGVTAVSEAPEEEEAARVFTLILLLVPLPRPGKSSLPQVLG